MTQEVNKWYENNEDVYGTSPLNTSSSRLTSFDIDYDFDETINPETISNLRQHLICIIEDMIAKKSK